MKTTLIFGAEEYPMQTLSAWETSRDAVPEGVTPKDKETLLGSTIMALVGFLTGKFSNGFRSERARQSKRHQHL